MSSHRTAFLAALLLLSLVACGGKKDPVRPPADQPAPDFSLIDVNPASATAGTYVSPQQYRGKISAWYFAFAT